MPAEFCSLLRRRGIEARNRRSLSASGLHEPKVFRVALTMPCLQSRKAQEAHTTPAE